MTDLEPEALEKARESMLARVRLDDAGHPIIDAATANRMVRATVETYLSHRRAALPAETREVVADLERQAAEQHEIAHDCDCAPEVTQNWKNAIGLRTAARLLTEQAALLAQPPATQGKE